MAVIGASAMAAHAAVKTKPVDYQYEDVTLKGHLYWDDATMAKRPGVLVVHEWWGLSDYAKKRASMLAELGYVALAVDMYGEGAVATHPDEAGKMMNKLKDNLPLWHGRAIAGLTTLQSQSAVDPGRIGAIGYCFGGSTALQLAMSGADVKGVVSFHGAILPVSAAQAQAIKAKVLVCHGGDDTFIPEKDCAAFRTALSGAGVDYQFIYFGGAKHSFTVAAADARGIPGMKYNADADRRSWQMMTNFFAEVLAK